jgi:hypothetical protein
MPQNIRTPQRRLQQSAVRPTGPNTVHRRSIPRCGRRWHVESPARPQTSRRRGDPQAAGGAGTPCNCRRRKAMLCHRATLAMAHSPVGSAPACPQKGTQLTLLAPRAQAQQRPVKVVERPRAASVQPSRPRTTATQRDHRACGYARHGGRYCPPPLGRPGQQPAAGRSPTRWRVERLFYNTFRQGVRNFLINLLTEVASGPQFTTGEFGSLLSSRNTHLAWLPS